MMARVLPFCWHPPVYIPIDTPTKRHRGCAVTMTDYLWLRHNHDAAWEAVVVGMKLFLLLPP